VHELATNAVKYGALSEPDGKIDIEWLPYNAKKLTFSWRETKAKPPESISRKGFGTELLMSFFDQARFDATPTGVHFSGLLPHAQR
jgi:two-component system CheB/CheR fusion protein